MAIGIEDKVVISAPNWPAIATVPPGDLAQYAPTGLGLAPPMIVQPWDTLEGALGRGSMYGANARTGDPFQDAPVNDATGGVVYFDERVSPEEFQKTLNLMLVNDGEMGYVVYAAESQNPLHDRYIAQLRIIEFHGMNLFGAQPAPDDKPYLQPLAVGALLTAFLDAQREQFGGAMNRKLRGTLGGDGDWAKESLAFGFMVENSYNGIYRIWSRPYLVTK